MNKTYSTISNQFSKYATHYTKRNSIQNLVCDRLLLHVVNKPKKILDIGCGSGAICSKIDWKYESFRGVDFAKGMLELHPKSKKIEAIYGDFNNDTLFDNLLSFEHDYILSSSALQWADNIGRIFQHINRFDAPISLAIFTSNTFKTINKTASINSILRDSKELEKIAKDIFCVESEVIEYRLEFDSTRDMFKYIKESGVSASRGVLSYKEMKKLMRDYPLNYLEFEVLFLYSV